jgi:hypothetical protein
MHAPSQLNGLVSEVDAVVSAITSNLCDRFPAEERAFAHLFDIFPVETFLSGSADSLDTFGNSEIVELIEMLSKQESTGKQFYCRKPFITPVQLDQV